MKTDQEIEQLAKERFEKYCNIGVYLSNLNYTEKVAWERSERSFQAELATAKLEGIKDGMRRAAEIASKENDCSCFYVYCPVAKRAKNSILSAINNQTL